MWVPVAVRRTTFVGLYATGSLGGPGDPEACPGR